MVVVVGEDAEVTRRWTLARQLLVLQLAIVSLVLVAVTAVSLAQSRLEFDATAGRRALAVAEALASSPVIRSALERQAGPGRPSVEAESVAPAILAVRGIAENARTVAGFTSVAVADQQGTVLASALPDELGSTVRLPGRVLTLGRQWLGTVETDDGPAVVAQVPVLGETGEQLGDVVGLVAVSRERPTLLDNLGSVLPNLLVYLGIASAVGVVGSLLLAGRVKRQTLGLEPREIAGLVEHREALLFGVREGVLALDPGGRVTLANAAAVELLGLPPNPVGVSVGRLRLEPAVRAALLGDSPGVDVPVAAHGRLLVLNRMPVTTAGRSLGSVTTLRDRTELLSLQREVEAVHDVTQTLRAQAHEFSNRLHTIAGLIELGEYDEVAGYVHRIGRSDAALTDRVTSRIATPAVAALLVAKASLATEQGVELRVAAGSRMGEVGEDMATDVATVLGNLVDNALDAVAGGPRDGGGWVEVEVVHDHDAVVVVVQDSGPGIDARVAGRLFERGVSTKPAPVGGRGIGLSLVELVCTGRGGSVQVETDRGTVFRARLPFRPAEVPEAAGR